ncbi:MAG: ABC transporter permease [Parafilimonas terrae]|nr:ABC transporter permease [Parafilimonas terrae]
MPGEREAPRRETARRETARREPPLVPAASIAGRALVTVIAIMTFLASLAAGGAVLVGQASAGWQHALAQEVTVQVRPVAGHDIGVEVEKAVGLIRAAKGVAGVDAFTAADSEKLLEPWLGSGFDLGTLPIPRLVVVKLDDKTPPDLAALRQTLEGKVAGVSLDDHELWLARLATMARTLVFVAVVLFVLVLVATALAVGFATRGVVAGNREIVNVLHFVGAEDRFIAREFQRHFRRLGLEGGLIGGGAAAVAFLLAGVAMATMAATPSGEELRAMFGSFGLGPLGYLVIAAIAGGIGIATGSTSRLIVFRHLRSLD